MFAKSASQRERLKGGGNITAFERCREHCACSVGQIVCLIYKHGIFARGCILTKVAMQVHLRVENIVIVANDNVAKLRKLELQLVRANIIFGGNFFYNCAAVSALPLQNFANSKRGALIKGTCARTVHGIAMARNTCRILFGFFVDTDLLSGGQDDRTVARACLKELCRCRIGFATSSRFSGQVKDLFALPLPQSTQGGIECGDRFSDSRRCVDKESLARADGAVRCANEVILPTSDRRERESSACNGRKQYRLALLENSCTVFHTRKEVCIKFCQLGGGVFFFDVSNFTVVYAIIGQANLNMREIFGAAQKVRVALDLRKVDGCRRH